MDDRQKPAVSLYEAIMNVYLAKSGICEGFEVSEHQNKYSDAARGLCVKRKLSFPRFVVGAT